MGEEIAATKEATGSEAIRLQKRPTIGHWLYNALPVLKWLPAYQSKWLRADLIAGVTLAAYLMPAGLADASLANLPPEAGLYACLFSGLVFWLFCSSRQTAITVISAIPLFIRTRYRAHFPVTRLEHSGYRTLGTSHKGKKSPMRLFKSRILPKCDANLPFPKFSRYT